MESNKERQAPETIGDAEATHLARYQFALNYIDKRSNVLDIPCGTGYGTKLLATKARVVCGVDISLEAIQHGQQFFHDPKITFLQGDMEHLDALHLDKKWDVIVSFEGIEHIRATKAFLSQVKELLSEEGILIISTPRKPHGSPYHVTEYSLEEYTNLLSEFFIIDAMFGQIYTDIFDMKLRNENPYAHPKFNFIAVCRRD
jgi:2-polyprenyl-3-methyl-5-hydroxy-6-metoxy-1,4-benzoquinol methylase